MERDDESQPQGWRTIVQDDNKHQSEHGDSEQEAAAGVEVTGLAPRRGDSIRQQAPSASVRSAGQSVTPVRRRKPRIFLWSFLIALTIVVAASTSVLFYLWNGLRTPEAGAKVELTIERGMRAQKVAELLEEKGLIRNAMLFNAWMKIRSEGTGFQAGVYEMKPGMTREDIVKKLNSGDIIAPATLRFTIPEGFTIIQMADRLAEAKVVDKDEFLAEVQKTVNWSGSIWTQGIPQDTKQRYMLEGYLFPDTYEVKRDSTAATVINRMLSELDRKIDQLPEDWQTVMEEQELTMHEVLTIASLIEREVIVDEERALVSGIIHNRLAKGMPLQIDATIQYLLDKQKERLLTEDLKVESPYNTYLNNGLPPGPIAAPSYKSIEAALYPEDSDYMYYVTKKDGTNTHLFAVTYNQHLKNINTSEKNAKKAQ